MTADVAIISAVYDSYDTVKPVLRQSGLDVEWILVTDTVPDADAAAGWTVVHEPKPGLPPVRAAKAPKLEPWKYTDAPASIWVDASYRITSPTFALAVLELADPIAQFVHPWRDCLYAEAAEVARLGMDPDGVAAWQAAQYRKAKHPEHWGLWASGVIVRQHTPAVKRMGALWAKEVEAGSSRDQVAQPFVLRKSRLRPTALPGSHLGNQWLSYEGSGRHR